MQLRLHRLLAVFATALAISFVAARTAEAADPPKGQLAAYVWAESARAPGTYTPSARYQFNMTNGINTVTRSGPGVYQVKLADLKLSGGHGQVTAYGNGPDYCKIVSWSPSGADTVVTVACFAPNGTPFDTQFALAFFT